MCWLEIFVRDRLTPDGTRITEGEGEAFPDEARVKLVDCGTVAVHRIRQFDLDVDSVGIRVVDAHFDSSITSGSRFGKG